MIARKRLTWPTSICCGVSEAAFWYRKVAEQKHDLSEGAQLRLAALYETGNGVFQNFGEAFHWYLSAAERSGQAAEKVAEFYEKGIGVAQSYEKAADWYLKATNMRNAFLAPLKLGEMYEAGRGLPKNVAQALKWYRKAAVGPVKSVNVGSFKAQMKLGRVYAFGLLGVDKSLSTAAKWYRMAADRRPGIGAPLQLAEMYNGSGSCERYWVSGEIQNVLQDGLLLDTGPGSVGSVFLEGYPAEWSVREGIKIS